MPDRRHCTTCGSDRSADVCPRCGVPTIEPDPRWESPRTPDVAPIREIAREVGYAIGEHGSRERDLDLIAVPWTADAVGVTELVTCLAAGLGAHVLNEESKPHGRVAVTLQLDAYVKQIDLSIMPRAT